jgi:hypothetical protein
MIDGGDDADAEITRDATPHDGAGEDDDEAHTPAIDDEDEEGDSPPQITTIPRRRGRGRGPGRPPKTHLGTPEVGDDGSESGTPFKRKRGRPVGSGRGGFRGRRKGAPPEAPHVMFEGNKYDVVNDEAQIDQDEEGNEKVDENGHLLGGREYRVRTFTIEGRGERLYMLSTEPARCCGFRDSYLFFTKHPKLYKVLVSDSEKKDLIEREVLPSSYKGRNIGVVVARSVFREFGARIIVGGRRIIDDYKVSQAREAGVVEGELADPDDMMPGKDEPYNRNRYVAWFGASEVYRQTGGATTTGAGKPAAIGSKRRNNITIGNWQFMHAKEARYVYTLAFLLRFEQILTSPQPFQCNNGSYTQVHTRRRLRSSHKYDVLPYHHATNSRQMGANPTNSSPRVITTPHQWRRPHQWHQSQQRRPQFRSHDHRPSNPTHNLHLRPASRLPQLRRNRHNLHRATNLERRLPRPRRHNHRHHLGNSRPQQHLLRHPRRAAGRLQARFRRCASGGSKLETAMGHGGAERPARRTEDRL